MINSATTQGDETTTSQLTLMLSVRDVQCVTVMLEMCATLLAPHAKPEDVQGNYDALEDLFDDYYSGTEWDALRKRLWALLPDDSPLTFTDPRLMHMPGSTVIQ